MNALAVAAQVCALFLVMLVGLFAKKRRIVDDGGMTMLSRLVMTITLPALGITAFQRSFELSTLAELGLSLAIGLAVYAVCLAGGWFATKRMKVSRRAVFCFALVFSNASYMGIPVIQAALGADGVLLSMAHQIAFTLVLWTGGVGLFQGKEGIRPRNILTNAGLWGLVVGLALFLCRVTLPTVLMDALSMIAGLTTPLSMLLVGAQLAQAHWRDFLDPSVYLLALFRLVVIPLALWLVLRLLNTPYMVASVAILTAAMPVAATTTVFAGAYGSDASYAARQVFVSTVLSIATVPLWVWILG